MPSTFLITGCSRGLGLALATELSKKGHTVFATARDDPAPPLNELIENSQGLVKYVKLDVESRSSVEEAEAKVATLLGDKGLDVLINNAGVINWMSEGIDKMTDLDSMLHTNVTSAHVVTSTFLPLLKKGTEKKVANISTTVGSITTASKYSMMAVPAYKVSKAALNMLTVQYALNYAEEGFTFLAISPGWLRTDLGGSAADLDVETGAKATLEAIQSHGKEFNGKFVNIRVAGWEHSEGLNQYDGEICPW
ncbi:NAD(P)-binding Rossmann-fold containing protein [Venustampulla echinocandica]|uniref:NAD(P)-binding Rossmann-fold containing protein n=1 Tax=Venustampulla echinocandica TaxID=2656787 RepID=A0A370TG43_9HELO|nr:NAD(P)-binding Rossmann-fold containing protein [Venustampulla echinocandica]RDL33851.1 NAD(P)-binding Rossmann-fold containing protein [Venustampulla echinocandica]